MMEMTGLDNMYGDAKHAINQLKKIKCTWTYQGEDFDYWETDCGHDFCLMEGGSPTKFEMNFCPFCGKPIGEAWRKWDDKT